MKGVELPQYHAIFADGSHSSSPHYMYIVGSGRMTAISKYGVIPGLVPEFEIAFTCV